MINLGIDRQDRQIRASKNLQGIIPQHDNLRIFLEYLQPQTYRLQRFLSEDRHSPLDTFQDLIVLSHKPLMMNLRSVSEIATFDTL